IWQATLIAVRAALATHSGTIEAIGITNQRETVVFWRRTNLTAPRNAIVWQDRRTSAIVDELRARPNGGSLEARVREITGLGLDPYFSSTKLTWVARHEPSVWQQVVSGEVAVGTVDSYLIARLTGGTVHVTDASNASRTQLLDIRTGEWSPEMLALFGVPESALPKVVPSSGKVGAVTCAELPELAEVPIAGIAGDQQAALFGHGAFAAGDTKCTYGTGAFILQNTGTTAVESNSGLLTTIAWMLPHTTTGQPEITYALEGSVFVAGAAVQWLRDGLEMIESAAELNPLAEAAGDNGGVVFVPALTGLGAPHWQPEARGALLGLTRATSRGNIAQATIEAIAFQVRQVFDLFGAEAGLSCNLLAVDGGASANDRLMQLQADALATKVMRNHTAQVTALGAAYLAGLGVGVWSSLDEIKTLSQIDCKFDPAAFDQALYARWCHALELVKNF
ncbi:MAG: glycerol kinase GlpK, partial [Actinomycetota bacterium]